MAVRTASEIIGSVRGMFGEQTPEGYAELLEDISDSIKGVDMSDYVAKADYDAVVTERDSYQGKYNDMRDRYINRFYNNYDAPNDKGYIMSASAQSTLEKDEKDVTYDDLFE